MATSVTNGMVNTHLLHMIKIISSDQILLTAFDISEFTEKEEL